MHEEYLSRGWKVFPLIRNGKTPAIKGGFKGASNEPEVVKGLFASGTYNVGIATGAASGITVIDVDVKHDAKGDESIRALERQYGALPDTLEVITCTGGRHLYFKYIPGVRCSTGIAPGIDVRNDGGYVVAPPSVVDGREYVWEVSNDKLAEAPEWLVKLLHQKRTGLIKEGERNDALYRRGVALRKGGMEYAAILTKLQEINLTQCIPPLPDTEVAMAAASAAKLEPARQSDAYTDDYNRTRFVEKYKDMVRYCPDLGGWYIWDGVRWIHDPLAQTVELARDIVHEMEDEARASSNTSLLKHAVKSGQGQRIREILSLSKSAPEIACHAKIFDRGNYLINCGNGTLDLNSGVIRPFAKEDYLTKRIDVDYTPSDCPTWKRFLDTIFLGNAETIHFMHKAIGYSLSASIEEQCIFILYGIGSNGKSTFLETIRDIVGEYAAAAGASTIMEKRGDNSIPNDIARLRGARFVTVNESDECKRLSESIVKSITGGDLITARFLHHEYFEFHSTFKIFMATNHKPRIVGTDNGIWRRIKQVPFKKVISKEERDPGLKEKLLQEREGILAWMVEGFKLWRKEGLGSCKEVDDAVQEYKDDQDVIGEFIGAECVEHDSVSVFSHDLNNRLNAWLKDTAGLNYKIGKNKMAEYMEQRGYRRERASKGDGRGKIKWYGIGLKTDENPVDGYGDRPF